VSADDEVSPGVGVVPDDVLGQTGWTRRVVGQVALAGEVDVGPIWHRVAVSAEAAVAPQGLEQRRERIALRTEPPVVVQRVDDRPEVDVPVLGEDGAERGCRVPDVGVQHSLDRRTIETDASRRPVAVERLQAQRGHVEVAGATVRERPLADAPQRLGVTLRQFHRVPRVKYGYVV
jgi:hypothetical protein